MITTIQFSLFQPILLLPLLLAFAVKCDVDVTVPPIQESDDDLPILSSNVTGTGGVLQSSTSKSPPKAFNESDSQDPASNRGFHETCCEPNKTYNYIHNVSAECMWPTKNFLPVTLRIFGALVWFVHWTDREKLDVEKIHRYEGIGDFFRHMDYVLATLVGVTIPILYLTATAILISHRKPSKKSKEAQEENDLYSSYTTDREGFFRAYARPEPITGRDTYGRYSDSDVFPMMSTSNRASANVNIFQLNAEEEVVTRL